MYRDLRFRKTQEGCGGLGGENPAAFPKAGPILQQPFLLPESAQTLAGIAFRAAGKSGNNFPAASKFAGKPFQQGVSDSHSLLEFQIDGQKLKRPCASQEGGSMLLRREGGFLRRGEGS